ncbi:MAG: hypothetical protein ABIJ96_08375 [Elusimicrobiota bacterium]
MDITKIKGQHLSSVIAGHNECQSCGYVGREGDWTLIGFPCPNCKKPSDGGRMFFHVGILSTINLIQEFYHADSSQTDDHLAVKGHHLAVVIFFCTLLEVLLEDFLREFMFKEGLKANVQERLLKDNLFPRRRVEKLFPALAGKTWKDAIAEAGAEVDRKPNPTIQEALDFYLKANTARNKCLHGGNKWAIGHQMSWKCLRHTPPLLDLFAWLHNRYVAEAGFVLSHPKAP